MEYYLNILHFSLYKAHYACHLLFNKINPFMLIHKLPFQKRKYKELGIDINQTISKAFNDKEYGLSVTAAGGALMGLLFLLLMGSSIIASSFLSLRLSLWYFIILVGLSSVASYVYVFKDDKYLEYFDALDKHTPSHRKRYYTVSAIFIAAVLGLLVLAFSL